MGGGDLGDEELTMFYLGRKGWVALTWTQSFYTPFSITLSLCPLSPSSFWVISISSLFSEADRLFFLLPHSNLLFTYPLSPPRPPAWQPAL